MPEYITLMGAEDVRSAGVAMGRAASVMQSAASSMEDSLQRHRIFLDEWIMRLETALDKKPIHPTDTGG